MPCLVLREKLKFSGAGAAAGIGEALPLFGNKLPVVGTRLEGELQYAKGRGIAQFAVGLRRAERAVILAAGANDEFANAALGIGGAIRRLRGEAVGIMVVGPHPGSVAGFLRSVGKGANRRVRP